MNVEYGIYKIPQKEVDDAFNFIQSIRDTNTGKKKYELVEICWSDDIGEELEHGEYLYEYVEIKRFEEYWIYMKSSHPWGIPDRIIKFNSSYQMYLERDCDEVEVCPVNMNWFEAFFFVTPICIRRLKELLSESDRPRLIDKIRRTCSTYQDI